MTVNVMAGPLSDGVGAVPGEFSEFRLQQPPCRVPLAAVLCARTARNAVRIVFAGREDRQRQGIKVGQAGPSLIATPTEVDQLGYISPALTGREHESAASRDNVCWIDVPDRIRHPAADAEIVGESDEAKQPQPEQGQVKQPLGVPTSEGPTCRQTFVHVRVARVDEGETSHMLAMPRCVDQCNEPAERMTSEDIRRINVGCSKYGVQLVCHPDRCPGSTSRLAPADAGAIIKNYGHISHERPLDRQPVDGRSSECCHDHNGRSGTWGGQHMQLPTVDFHQFTGWRIATAVSCNAVALIGGAGKSESTHARSGNPQRMSRLTHDDQG